MRNALRIRAAASYALATVTGNLLFLPFVLELFVALLPACLTLGLPFLGLGLAVVLLAPRWVCRNLAGAATAAGLLPPALWVCIDTNDDLPALYRSHYGSAGSGSV